MASLILCIPPGRTTSFIDANRIAKPHLLIFPWQVTKNLSSRLHGFRERLADDPFPSAFPITLDLLGPSSSRKSILSFPRSCRLFCVPCFLNEVSILLALHIGY